MAFGQIMLGMIGMTPSQDSQRPLLWSLCCQDLQDLIDEGLITKISGVHDLLFRTHRLFSYNIPLQVLQDNPHSHVRWAPPNRSVQSLNIWPRLKHLAAFLSG